MSRVHVDHRDIVQFAEDRVNLPRDQANDHRAQARRVREKVEAYVKDHADYSLKKIMLSGSLAKGTALKSLNDIDMACYIGGAEAPEDTSALLEYLAERLRRAFPNFKPDQVTPQTYSVQVSFRGSGLDVDVVPILYDGDPDWFGSLVSQEDGSFLLTNIPYHLDFTRRRKKLAEKDFAQVIRIVKYWVRFQKTQSATFKFKSFMVELIMSHLLDDGFDFSNYIDALQNFYTYIAKTDLRERVVFSDYYSETAVQDFSEPVQIIDPVNPENNASRLYTQSQADEIVSAALDAGDAIAAADTAPTKSQTVYYWQKVLGPTFNP